MSAGKLSREKPIASVRAAVVMSLIVWTAVCTIIAIWLLRPETGADLSSFAFRAAVVVLIAIFAGVMLHRRKVLMADWVARDSHITSPQEFQNSGIGPLPADAPVGTLYLDLMKRMVMNVIYEDRPTIFYDNTHVPMAPDRYRLERRIMGEDAPTVAHSMAGKHRLDNLEKSVEQLLRDNVPGDLLEAGVLRGGTSIFMRAVLKAHHCSDRRVIACDTFRARPTPRPSLVLDLVLGILSMLAYIPSLRLHRAVLGFLHRRLKPEMRSFPVTEDPSPELVRLTMYHMRRARQSMTVEKDQTGLDAVRSHFAAYGLLDEQVVFLPGFFNDTLPTAPIDKLALIRLDGDTYESTLDILEPLYSKLSKGGYCIVDDYNAFPDCRRAVEEYRAKHGITDELHHIDNLAAYWRKS